MAWWDDIGNAVQGAAQGAADSFGQFLQEQYGQSPEWIQNMMGQIAPPAPPEFMQYPPELVSDTPVPGPPQGPSDVGVQNWQTELADWRAGNINYRPEEMPGKLRDASLITQDEYELAKTLKWRNPPDGYGLPKEWDGGMYQKPEWFWENVELAKSPKKYGYKPRYPDVHHMLIPGRVTLGTSKPQVAQHELRHARYEQQIPKEEQAQFIKDYFDNRGNLVLPSGQTFPELYENRWNYDDPTMEPAEAYAELANLYRGQDIPEWLAKYYGFMPEWSGEWNK